MVSPSSVCGARSSSSASMVTPAAAQVSTMFWCQSTVNHSLKLSAITSPTPSVSARSATGASISDCTEWKRDASARAAVGPTWRMDSATMTRHRSAFLAVSRLAKSFLPEALTSPSFRVYTLDFFRSSSVRSNSFASSSSTPEAMRSCAPFSPSASISNAPREAMYSRRVASCAGQERVFGQRQSASPSFAGASFVPQTGQFSG